MRRFFISLFVLSLIATAGTIYWRTYLPEKTVSAAAPQAESRGFRERNLDTSPSGGSSSQEVTKAPSARQDFAVTISIVSSIISAVAAVFQTWLTARAFRR